jgi:CO/xanthine dehydrogenase FAD-binding subunit
MITIRNYVRPQSLDEAYQLNQNKQNKIIGGMLWLKMENIAVGNAIDLCDLGLNTIDEDEDAFSIGASVTLRQLETHETLNAFCNNAVEKAVRDIVGVQFRNLATVGGSIWGRFGFSDVLTVFLAFESYVELYNAGIIPLWEFAQMKYDRDILIRLIVKKHHGNFPGNFSYLSMRNSRTDFPVIACALSETDGIYRTAIGARPGRAVLITDENNILSDGLNLDSITKFASYVAENVQTGSNMRGSAKFRTHLINVLVTRGLQEFGEL